MKTVKSGFSLVEAILVIFVGGLLILLVASLPNAFNLVNKSKNMSLAREIAVKQVEDLRSISFSNLALGTENIDDNRIALLPQGSGSVTVEDCDIAICTNGEDIKLIKVSVNWKENNKDQIVDMVTLIGEGGLNQ